MANTTDILLRTDQAVELTIINPDTAAPVTQAFANYQFVGAGYDRKPDPSTFTVHNYSTFIQPRITGIQNQSDKIKWNMFFTVRVGQDVVRKLQELWWVSERRKELDLSPWITVRDRRALFGEPGTTNSRPISFGTVQVTNGYAEYYADFDMAFATPAELFNQGSSIIGRPSEVKQGASTFQPDGALRVFSFTMKEGDKRTA